MLGKIDAGSVGSLSKSCNAGYSICLRQQDLPFSFFSCQTMLAAVSCPVCHCSWYPSDIKTMLIQSAFWICQGRNQSPWGPFQQSQMEFTPLWRKLLLAEILSPRSWVFAHKIQCSLGLSFEELFQTQTYLSTTCGFLTFQSVAQQIFFFLLQRRKQC